MVYELVPDEAPSEPQESFLSSTGKEVGRFAARTASRIGEQIAGAPGDIFSFINDVIARPATEAVTGQKGVPYEETVLGKILPTSEQHKKVTTKAFGKYIEPQNDIEKFSDTVFSDATALANPLLRGAKFLKQGGSYIANAVKSLAISTAANGLGSATKDLTADEGKAGMVKIGSMFLLSLMDKKKAAQAVGEMYKPLSEQVVKLKPVDATGLSRGLRSLMGKMTKGTMAPSEKFIFDESSSILSKIRAGKITPEELWAVKRSLNEKLSKVLFDIPKKADQARARKLAKGILRDVDDTMKLTAKQDPNFYKQLKSVDKAFGTIAESNWISNYIEKNMKYTPLTHGLMEMFRGSVGSTVATVGLPYQAAKILYRIGKSPVLAKHYAKTLAAAGKDDAIIMNREMKKLDQGLQKEENKKKRYILID